MLSKQSFHVDLYSGMITTVKREYYSFSFPWRYTGVVFWPYPSPMSSKKPCSKWSVYYTPPRILKDSLGLLGTPKDSSSSPPPLLKSPYSVLRYSEDSSKTPQGVYQLQIKDSLGSPQGVLMDSSKSLQGLLRT